MIRNLKALGLALVAIFALSAMAASAASAQNGMVTSNGPVYLGGTDSGPILDRQLTAFGGQTKCETAHYTGGAVGGTSGGHHTALASGQSSFTLTPVYTNCESGTGLPETVTMNGCDYVVNIGTTVGVDEYAATTSLVCPEGKEITIDVYANAAAHAANTVLCSIHVPAGPNANLVGGRVKDDTSGHLILGGTANNVTMTSTCGQGTTNAAVLHLSVTLAGSTAATGGNPTSLSLSHS